MIQTRKKPEGRKTNILIVDDHPIARRGLAQLINQEPDLQVCADVENMTQALEVMESRRPDLVIVDISLKESSGLELVRSIKARFDDLPMLVFSMHEEALCAERALEAGALGYVMKQEPTEIIMAAIRRVLEGHTYLSELMTSRLLNKPASAPSKKAMSPLHALSSREFEVFALIGQGKRTVDIAAMLHLSVKTIESHRAHILKKLKLRGWYELSRYAFQWFNTAPEARSATNPPAALHEPSGGVAEPPDIPPPPLGCDPK
ncbi:MAG: response regulator transcription factor [Verrucomicrobia bacterium]|nr:response regulator transcription factor [Verrucomicrobiota bacterium]